MSKITNQETLDAKRELLDLIAVCIAQLKSLDTQVRRDYRGTAFETAIQFHLQASDLTAIVSEYVKMPAREKP